jgi:hypothetical protein
MKIKNNKLNLIIAFIGVFLIFIGIGVLAIPFLQLYKDSEDSALQSCILSVEEELTTTLKKNNLRNVIKIEQSWKSLDEKEKFLLLNAVDKEKQYDCYDYLIYEDAINGKSDNLQIFVKDDNGLLKVQIQVK